MKFEEEGPDTTYIEDRSLAKKRTLRMRESQGNVSSRKSSKAKPKFQSYYIRPFIPTSEAGSVSQERENRIHKYLEDLNVFSINVKIYLESIAKNLLIDSNPDLGYNSSGAATPLLCVPNSSRGSSSRLGNKPFIIPSAKKSTSSLLMRRRDS